MSPGSLTRPRLARAHPRRRDQVVLSPLCPGPGEQAVGYVAHLEEVHDDVGRELGTIRWTLQALQVLAPDAFLLTFPSPTALSSPALEMTLGRGVRRSVLFALEAARVGRRRAELQRAVANARRLGVRLAVTGHRLSSSAGFDTIVVRPRTAAICLDPAGKRLIVLDVASDWELGWARQEGAALMEGEAIGEPLKVAPVDLNRLRR